VLIVLSAVCEYRGFAGADGLRRPSTVLCRSLQGAASGSSHWVHGVGLLLLVVVVLLDSAFKTTTAPTLGAAAVSVPF
jgi:hypothetical protein